MFKKLIAIAALAVLISAPLAGQAKASTYPTVFGTTVSATVPVHCNFYMPSLTAGTLTDSWATGASGSAPQYNYSYSSASCNVAFTPMWSSDNGLTATSNANQFTGTMKGADAAGNTQTLSYNLTVPFTGSQSWCGAGSCSYASGTYSISIPFQNAVGGVTYSDVVRLTINY